MNMITIKNLSTFPKTLQAFVTAPSRVEKISEVSNETGSGDGYWIILSQGWQHEDCHAVHEWNATDLMRSFKLVAPCQCEDCLGSWPDRK